MMQRKGKGYFLVGAVLRNWLKTQGRMQDFSWGGGNSKMFWIVDIAAVKLRAVARGVWGHAPQENFYK